MGARKKAPRRYANIERELALDALSGKRAGHDLLVKGLVNFLSLRRNLGAALTDEKGRTQIRLPYGTRVDLMHNGPDGLNSPVLARYVPKNGAGGSTQLPKVAAGWILDRAHGKVEVIAKACLGIERARKALLDHAELTSRWL